MPSLPDRHALEALRAYDTPTICNALEIVVPARRAIGFTRRPLVACFPEMKPVVAFARTAMIRSREPHPRDRVSANRIRLGYYEHIAAEPLPSLAVIQDIDLLTRREKVLIEASKQPGFSVDRLRQAYREQDEIH